MAKPGKPRKTRKHLPKYVSVLGGTFWYRPTHGEHVRMTHADGSPIRGDDEAAMYRWMADKTQPITNEQLLTLGDCFDRYEQEVVPSLAPRTQKDYRRMRRQGVYLQDKTLNYKEFGRREELQIVHDFGPLMADFSRLPGPPCNRGVRP